MTTTNRGEEPIIEVTSRGDLANRHGDRNTAAVVFLDPIDAPFLEDWVSQSKDGRWGLFEAFVMLDRSIAHKYWQKTWAPKPWSLPLPRSVLLELQTAPTPALARSVVALFPQLAGHSHVLFACTYGKSRSALAAQAFRAWRQGQSLDAHDALASRNPWWHYLLGQAMAHERGL